MKKLQTVGRQSEAFFFVSKKKGVNSFKMNFF